MRLLLAILLCCQLLGCAGLKTPPWSQLPPEQSAGFADTLLQKDWLAHKSLEKDGDQQLIRLQGRLLLGSRKIALSAVMRRSPERRTARIVIMGDMGVTLCDMDATLSGHITHSAVPDLEKAPRVLRHVARTVRRIFLLPAPQGTQQVSAREGRLMLQEKIETPVAAQTVQRIYSRESGLLVGLRSPDAQWEANFIEYEQKTSDGLPYPARIEYRDSSGGYTVQLLLLSLKTEP